MNDVGAVIERLYRTYLYPPDSQPATAFLDGAIGAADTSLVLSGFVIPEDEELVANGVLLELGWELVQVTAYDSLTLTATVKRGQFGTTAVAHADADKVILSPPFSRQSVFEAVADNIITLYPSLFTVNTTEVVEAALGVAPIDDNLAVEVLEVWTGMGDQEVDARIVDYHPEAGGRAVVTNLGMFLGSMWVKYRRRMGVATSESDTLADLGVETRWVSIVMAGAAADLFAGRDLPASNTDWVQASLEAENIPVGTRGSVARQLAAYRAYLLEGARREMRAEYRAKSHMRPVMKVVTRSPFG